MVNPTTAVPPASDVALRSGTSAAGRRKRRRRPVVQAEVARVIRTKIQPPPLRGSTLSRPRLLDRLKAATEHRLTLLVAEAGYGKTTLLTDFSARSERRCLWYKLDSTDRDHVTLVNYLVAAAAEVEPDVGEATLALLSGNGREGQADAVQSLMSELGDMHNEPTVLILDDFHAVDDSPEARDVVAQLLRDAPPNFHFVVSSRRRPPMPLARLAGMGELSEISTDDLRFSREETRRLFADAYGQPLETEVLKEVDVRTEGWAASLQLLYSSIRGRPASAVRALTKALSGASGPIYDFLAEEVIGQLSPDLEQFVLRGALLDRILPDRVVALFGDVSPPPSVATAREWISEADNLGLLSRGSQTSETRQFHPLLREFLLRQLRERETAEDLARMHARVARVTEPSDPIAACHHYIEADQPDEALRVLGASVLLTMGSGRWGAASQLIGRLSTVPAEPALVAIQARRLFEEGDTTGAAALLASTNITDQPAAIRAALRQTRVSMGWRSGDSGSLLATVREIGDDPETPEIMREIAQIFIDSSPLSANPAPFPDLARRLESMAEAQAQAGHHYYSAISFHNAAIALSTSGAFTEAQHAAASALKAFESVQPTIVASYSTHAVLAACAFELGQRLAGMEEILLATSSGDADGDVQASCAFTLALIGQRDRSVSLLAQADERYRQGRSDISGSMLAGFARCLLALGSDPDRALQAVMALPEEVPLDLELTLQHKTLTALAHLMSGHETAALRVAEDGLVPARRRQGRRFEARLALLSALARHDGPGIRRACAEAAMVGELAILEVADALGPELHVVADSATSVAESIAAWPERWLPILRRQLDKGNVPPAHAAARLLDVHGELSDVGRLRAFEKTYGRRGRSMGLGRQLARRVSPRLEIHDLGRTTLRIGDREVRLSGVRRKPASLLLYLISRPKFTATREQVLDDLWPESDPASALNSLNQSLYFIRREIDPWYEDDVSADYISYEAELLWLDSRISWVQSAEFVDRATQLLGRTYGPDEATSLMDLYKGQFAPEFEYEEWATAWRSRVHATYLSFATASIARLVSADHLHGALAVAQRCLASDPTALDVERKLVWLYARAGATSAANAQYQHLAACYRADELDPPAFLELSSGLMPP